MATEITLENKSKTVPIVVSLNKTDQKADEPRSALKLIRPEERVSTPKNFDGGCAKMNVYSIRPEDVDLYGKNIDLPMVYIWEGNIPVCSNVTIEIYPESKQVKYKGRDLPKCTACENAGGDSKDILPSNYDTRDKWYYKQMWYWYALLVVLAIILLYLLFVKI